MKLIFLLISLFVEEYFALLHIGKQYLYLNLVSGKTLRVALSPGSMVKRTSLIARCYNRLYEEEAVM